VGRKGEIYDAVIIFKKSLLADKNIRLNHNGVVSTEDVVPSKYIDLIYVIPARGGQWILYNSKYIKDDCSGHLSIETAEPLPGALQLNPQVHDPFGLWADPNSDWRYCPNQKGQYKCKAVIPAGFTVCPYCRAPLVFAPAIEGGGARRMPMAAAAVALAVPPGGPPAEPTAKLKSRMQDAIVHGDTRNSATSDFRRSVKELLTYRDRWDTQMKDKADRASKGNSRWYPGRLFPTWDFNTVKPIDPGRDGFLRERILHDNWVEADLTGKTKHSRMLMLGIVADDIEEEPTFKMNMKDPEGAMAKNPMLVRCVSIR
jgi:hypothetical protein